MTRAAGCARRARLARRRLSASAVSVTVQELTMTTSAGASSSTTTQPAARRRSAIVAVSYAFTLQPSVAMAPRSRGRGPSGRGADPALGCAGGGGAQLVRDPPAADHELSAIEDGRLPGRDERTGFDEADLGRVGRVACDGREPRLHRPVAMSDAHREPRAGRRRRARGPDGSVRHEALGDEASRPADRDRPGRAIDGAHVPSRAAAEPEAATLSDREAVHAIVGAEEPTVVVDDASGPQRRGPGVPLDEARRVAVRYEAHLHALRLVGHRQPERARLCTHLALRQLADREERTAERHVIEGEEEIRLVLRRVDRGTQRQPARDLVGGDARIVSGREPGGPELTRAPPEQIELHVLVAERARVRR